MARRRTARLAAALLALALSGCSAAHAGTVSARPVAAAASTSGSPSSVASTASTPPSSAATGSKSPGKQAGPKVPPKPGTSSSAPAPGGSSSSASGHGPSGAMSTTGTSAVALTFDDGPYAYSNQVLDLLAKFHIKATFCVIGRQVAASADIIKRIVAEGHTLCNHTWDHDLQLRNRSADQIRGEMQRTTDAIHAVVPDAPIKYFRAPGGGWSPDVVNIAASLGMTSIHWAVDPWDWKKPPPQAIINNVLGHTGPGSIVLMHDGGGDRSSTVTALRTILPNLAGRFTLIALPTS